MLKKIWNKIGQSEKQKSQSLVTVKTCEFRFRQYSSEHHVPKIYANPLFLREVDKKGYECW